MAVTKAAVLFIICISTAYCLDKSAVKYYRERVRAMFQHAYEGYMTYAYPYDELQPISCKGHDTWGSFSLTLIDSLDTLVVLSNYTEFQRVVKIVSDHTDFDIDINASVFETNIRAIGQHSHHACTTCHTLCSVLCEWPSWQSTEQKA